MIKAFFFAKHVPETKSDGDLPINGEWFKYIGKNDYSRLRFLPTVHETTCQLEMPLKKMTVFEFPDDDLKEVDTLKTFCNAVAPQENVSRFLFLKKTPKIIDAQGNVELMEHVFFYFDHQGEDLITYVNRHASTLR